MLKRASSSFSLRSGATAGSGSGRGRGEDVQQKASSGKKKPSSLRDLRQSSCSPPRQKPSSFSLRRGVSTSSSSSSLRSGSPSASSSSCSLSSSTFSASHRISSWSGGGKPAAPLPTSSWLSPRSVVVVVARECDTDVPVIGSIECIRSCSSTDADNTAMEEKKQTRSYRSLMGLSKASSYDDIAECYSSSRRITASVVRIVCRPPHPAPEQHSDEDDLLTAKDGDNDGLSNNEDLVRFLLDSISELVDQEQQENKSQYQGSDSDDAGAHAHAQTKPTTITTVDGVLEALSFACGNPCANAMDCTSTKSKRSTGSSHHHQQLEQVPYARTKSILRTRGVDNGRSPVEAGILSDRTVSFSRLEIREFGMTLGDHPSAVSGPPVALDYDGTTASSADKNDPKSGGTTPKVVSLEEYERARTPRRPRKQLKLSYHDKCATLQDRGFSLQELHDAWAEAIKIRKQRQETLKQSYTGMLLDDFWESAGRKYHRMLESLALA